MLDPELDSSHCQYLLPVIFSFKSSCELSSAKAGLRIRSKLSRWVRTRILNAGLDPDPGGNISHKFWMRMQNPYTQKVNADPKTKPCAVLRNRRVSRYTWPLPMKPVQKGMVPYFTLTSYWCPLSWNPSKQACHRPEYKTQSQSICRHYKGRIAWQPTNSKYSIPPSNLDLQ